MGPVMRRWQQMPVALGTFTAVLGTLATIAFACQMGQLATKMRLVLRLSVRYFTTRRHYGRRLVRTTADVMLAAAGVPFTTLQTKLSVKVMQF
jgi:hypothetical protein